MKNLTTKLALSIFAIAVLLVPFGQTHANIYPYGDIFHCLSIAENYADLYGETQPKLEEINNQAEEEREKSGRYPDAEQHPDHYALIDEVADNSSLLREFEAELRALGCLHLISDIE